MTVDLDSILAVCDSMERRMTRLERSRGLRVPARPPRVKLDLDVVLAMADAMSRKLSDLEHKRGIRRADAEDWDEAKHPRAENGQFGSGGGGAKPKAQEKSGGKEKREVSDPRDEGLKVKTQVNGKEISGEVVASTAKTATIRDANGEEHEVPWKQVKGGTERGKDYIPASKFDATKFAAASDNAHVTPKDVFKAFPPDTESKMHSTVEMLAQRLNEEGDTQKRFKRPDGSYTPDRQALHNKILFEGITTKVMNEDTGEMEEKHFPPLISPQVLKNAKPPEGQKPTFTILGGRGGSGKSWFTKSGMIDGEKNLILDADHFKQLLPEYEGWNAGEVHEESSDLFDMATKIALDNGLNLVHDATMKTPEKAVRLVNGFKDKGYKVESHYMHLPREQAAKRAVGRYLGPTGRLVPPEIVLSNTENEKAFDEVRKLADKWSFRDNDVPFGRPPRLISESEGEA